MKKIFLFLLMIWDLVIANVGLFDSSGLTVGLFPQPIGTASQNTGSIVGIRGPRAPGVVTGTLTNMTTGYGWRVDSTNYRFDSTQSYISLGNNIGTFTDKMTIATYVKMPNVTTTIGKSIWAKLSGPTARIVLHRQRDDTFDLRVCNGSSTSVIKRKPTTPIVANEWFSAIMVIDLSQSVNIDRAKLYINGILCPVVGTPGVLPSTLPTLTTSDLRLGGWGSGDPTAAINGDIKYSLTFNTAKTVEEVAAIYALGPDLGGLGLKTDGSLYRIIPALKDTLDTFSFNVSTTDVGVTYQWYKNDVAITDSTNNRFTLYANTLLYSQKPKYYCILTNVIGSAFTKSKTYQLSLQNNKRNLIKK
jgi:hypothetical protein